MIAGKSILIVEDNSIDREILKKLLLPEYTVMEAVNGKEALDILKTDNERIEAVLTDIIMPDVDGFQLIEAMVSDVRMSNIPVIAMTANDSEEEEVKALKAGAWDFITKPFNADVVRVRLKNAIGRSQMEVARQMRFLVDHDQLSGLYNKSYFMRQTSSMLKENLDKKFVFIYFKINRFQLINSFYGEKEGDNLIIFVADFLRKLLDDNQLIRFGRVGPATFSICMEYNREDTIKFMADFKEALDGFNYNYDIEPSFGLYVIKDHEMSIEKMYYRAFLASKVNDSSYTNYYYFYTKEMGRDIKREQRIIKNMQKALDNEEFKVYLQPKYNIHNNRMCGSEALVRWINPKKGMIMPNDFIPIFERNGFITKVDYYVWEHVCMLIRRWLDQGIDVNPVSVNVSRVNIYNSKIADALIDLVEKYNIPVELLQLEITETAYTDNPTSLMNIVRKLRDYGFKILMDDFGSGYSSLSILKDIEVDILKVDMEFLTNTSDSGRGENIIASIIRMAKWLKIPVIVEGVESAEQVAFLRTVGCDFVQGFYYAAPMEVADYERLVAENSIFGGGTQLEKRDDFDIDTLFQSNPQMKVLFGDVLQALVIYEFNGETMEHVRINEGFYELFGSDDQAIEAGSPLDLIDEKYRKIVIDAFNLSVSTKGASECDYIRKKSDGTFMWVNLKLRYMRQVGANYLLLGLLEDVTSEKKIELELDKFRKVAVGERLEENVMLIVDDAAANRAILKTIFKEQYKIIEANDGVEAMEKLKENPSISIILLDLVMPRMNGWEFLEAKNQDDSISKIPVIVITAEDKYDEQMNALELGINDYIIKPFVPDIVRKRVGNVMDSLRFMHEIMKKYDSASQLAKIDKLTGLYYGNSARELIEEELSKFADTQNALILCEIENFDVLNDKIGTNYETSLLHKASNLLKVLFRSDDLVFRYRGDVFGVFARNFKDEKLLDSRCNTFIQRINDIEQEENIEIKCYIGVAFSPTHGDTFTKLYDSANEALVEAKKVEKNACCIYNGE